MAGEGDKEKLAEALAGEKREEGEAQPPAASSTSAQAEAAGEEGEDAPHGDEEDTGAQIAPLVKLEEVSVSTGEENEEVLFEIKSKLYRFDKEGNQWKERGVGQVKLLEHKDTKKIRLLMRQQRTLKICANHTVLPDTVLQEHAGSDKSWVWHASDFSEGELREELFTMRFGSIDSAQRFKDAFEDAQDKMSAILGGPEGEDGAADEAAEALGGLKVDGEEAGNDEADTEAKGKEEETGGEAASKEEPKAEEAPLSSTELPKHK